MELSEMLGMILLRPLNPENQKIYATLISRLIPFVQIQFSIPNFNLLVSCIRFLIKSTHEDHIKYWESILLNLLNFC